MNEMSQVISAAQAAFDKIRFYELLYGERPESVDDVSFISYVQYFRATGVLDCIDRSATLAGVIPPFHRHVRRFPYSIVESEQDLVKRQERIVRALRDTRIADEWKRFLIITSDENGPFACDLAVGLGWEQHVPSIFYFTGNRHDIQSQLDAHRPDYVFWCLPQSPHEYLEFPDDRIILAHHIDHPIPASPNKIWLFSDEVNLIGSRPEDRTTFDIDRSQFYIERDERSGLLHLTTLSAETLPLIRYALAHDIPGGTE